MKRLDHKRQWFWESVRILTKDGPVKLGNVTFTQMFTGSIAYDKPESEWHWKAIRLDLKRLRESKS